MNPLKPDSDLRRQLRRQKGRPDFPVLYHQHRRDRDRYPRASLGVVVRDPILDLYVARDWAAREPDNRPMPDMPTYREHYRQLCREAYRPVFQRLRMADRLALEGIVVCTMVQRSLNLLFAPPDKR